MMEVKEIRSLEQLEALEPRWNALLAESGVANPFLTFEWISSWWRSFGNGESGTRNGLRVIVVEAEGEPIAIAPLMSTTGSFFGLPLTAISNIVNDHSFRAGLIVKDRVHQVVRAIFRHLKETTTRWDVLSLRYLVREQAERLGLKETLAVDGGLVGEAPVWRSPYLPVTQDWESYFATVRGKTRCAVRRKVRRLECLPGFSIRTVANNGGGDLLDAIFEIDRKSWQYANASGLGSNPATRDFYVQIADRARERGWLRGHVLSVAGEPVAFEFNLAYDRVLYNLKLGYDSKYARYSPGLVLRYHVMQDAFRQGYREVDFLGEEDEYKLAWTRQARDHIDLYVSNPSSLLGLAFHGYHFKLKNVLKRIRPLRALVRGIRTNGNGSSARTKARPAVPDDSSHRTVPSGVIDPMTRDSQP